MPLRKVLGLRDLVFYGLGVIFGAGIYVLIGDAAGMAGNTVWMSFVIAAVVATFTGLSYAELSSMYPRDAAEYTYVKKAFRAKSAGFVAGWLTTATVILAASVVSLGFGKYLNALTGINPIIAAAGLILLFSFINYLGIRASSRINIVLTSITVLGLLLIIAIGVPNWGSIDYFNSPTGIAGTVGAATLIFFAYLGFDEIVNVSEEAKGARKNVPKAIVISIIISTVVYILVAVSAISTVPWHALGESNTPLALVAQTALGGSTNFLLSIFALFATASTTLIFMLAGSRMLFGMAEVHAMPSVLKKLGRHQTPYAAIAIIGAMALLAISANMADIALLVDFGAFAIFAMINLSAFALRFSEPDAKREFRTPLSIGRAPILPLLGFLVSCYMLTQFSTQIAWASVAIMIAGYMFYKFCEAGK